MKCKRPVFVHQNGESVVIPLGHRGEEDRKGQLSDGVKETVTSDQVNL